MLRAFRPLLVLLAVSSARAADPADLGPLPAENAGLSLAQLEEMAFQSNPTLAQAAADIQAAEGRMIQAGLYPNPSVSYTGQQIGASGAAGQQGFLIEQTIVRGGKLKLSRCAGSWEVATAIWNAQAQQRRVLGMIRIRYYAALATARLAAVVGGQVDRSRKMAELAGQLLKKKKTEEADIHESQGETETAQTSLSDAQYRHAAALRQLMIIVGRADLEPLGLQDVLDAPVLCADPAADEEAVVESSPELQWARADVVRRQYLLQRQQAELASDLDVQAGSQYDFASLRQQVQLQIGVNVPLFNRHQGKIREAEADLCRAQAEVRRVELLLHQRFAAAYRRYQVAQNDVRKYQERLLPHSERLLEMRLKNMDEKGQWTDVVDAQRGLFQLQRDFVQRLYALRRAEVLLTGLLCNGGLDQPSNLTPPSAGLDENPFDES